MFNQELTTGLAMGIAGATDRNGHSKVINGNTVWRQTYYIKCSNNTPLSSFQRRLYRLKMTTTFSTDWIIIQGIHLCIFRPHGNEKNEGGERDYRRTLPSVINQLKTGTVVCERAPS